MILVLTINVKQNRESCYIYARWQWTKTVNVLWIVPVPTSTRWLLSTSGVRGGRCGILKAHKSRPFIFFRPPIKMRPLCFGVVLRSKPDSILWYFVLPFRAPRTIEWKKERRMGVEIEWMSFISRWDIISSKNSKKDNWRKVEGIHYRDPWECFLYFSPCIILTHYERKKTNWENLQTTFFMKKPIKFKFNNNELFGDVSVLSLLWWWVKITPHTMVVKSNATRTHCPR